MTNSTDNYIEKEGIIDTNEPFETVYLNDDEIEKFMEKYLLENPGTEIETRYVNQKPIDIPQNIEIRWLRPITPEIPPIIIQEVNVIEKEEPIIKIVQRQSDKDRNIQLNLEPIVIREKPNPINLPEPKTIYLPTIIKRSVNESGKDIKIEHVRSDSQSVFDSRLTYDDQVFETKRAKQHSRDGYAYEHASIVDYESYEDEEGNPRYRPFPKNRVRSVKEDQEIQLYEEKLMQTLYEEYLLKLERERLERKLSSSGVFEERIRERERERSISQERSMSQSHRMSNRYGQTRSSNRFSQSQVRINEERLLQDQEIRMQNIRDEEFRQHQQRLRDEEIARYSRLTRTSQVKQGSTNERVLREELVKGQQDDVANSIVNKVTDESELKHWADILNNSTNFPQNTAADTQRTLSSIANVTDMQQQRQTKVSSPTKYISHNADTNTEFYSVRSPSYEVDKRFQKSSSTNLYNPYNESNSYNMSPRDESANERLNVNLNRNSETGLYNPMLTSNSDILSRSGSGNGMRRKVQTSSYKYYSSNYPNPTTVTENTGYIENYNK